MAFNPNNGIPAPLKTWQKILNDRNRLMYNSRTKNGYCSAINFPFGLKTFSLNYRDVPMNYGSITSKLTTTGISFSYMQPLNLATYEFRPKWGGTADFLNSSGGDLCSQPIYDPIVFVRVSKVKDKVPGLNRYSEYVRSCYYDPSTDNWAAISGIKFKVTGDLLTGPISYYDTKDIKEIEDWYIIEEFRIYDTDKNGTLPRKPSSNSINFYINFPSIIGVNRTDDFMNMAVDCLIPLPYYRGDTTNSGFRIISPLGTFNTNIGFIGGSNIYELISNLTVCNVLRKIGSTYIISDGNSIGQYFNTKCVLFHNRTEGEAVTSDVLPSSNKHYIYNISSVGDEHITVFAPTTSGNYGTLVFQSLDDITNMFADLGLKAVFDLNTAQNSPSDIISPDEIPSGFNTNLTPIVDSFPDNNTDDFFIDKGINPANMAVNASIFNQANIFNLLDWFTTGDFVDTMSRLFSDPLSAIFSIRYYPFDIVQHDSAGVEEVTNIKIVNVSNPNINGYQFLQGYNTVINGGELYYTAYYGNFADWACTKYDLYVPYLGIINISPSMVVNKTLRIFYNVDFITGNAQIFVKSYDSKYNKSGDNGQLVYTTMQKITIDIPITYTNFNEQNIYNATSALRAVTAISNGATSGATSGASGGVAGAIAGGVLGGIGAAANSAIDYATNYPRTEYGAKGDIGVGMLSPQDAYLLITRKILAIPANGYGNISGNPSAFYGLLKSASGYVRATSAKCDGIPATNSEINEIMSLLSAGIYI